LQEVYPKAKEYAQKAIQLDKWAPESHEARAYVYYFHEWNWDKVYQSVEKIIELNPHYAGAYLLKAMWLALHENIDESTHAMRMCIQLDPFNPQTRYFYSWILMFNGRTQESSDQLDKLFEISPKFPDAIALKGLMYQKMGEYNKAVDLFFEVQNIPGFETEAYSCLGNLFFETDQPDKANEYLEKLLKAEKRAYARNIAFHIALLYAHMNKRDEMYRYLNRSVENREWRLIYIQWYTVFTKYHQDSRFVEVVKKIGLGK
jgi:tetratricopeptide (TPR) repeat protein